MRKIETYLTFNGNCADAMRFYEKALGGKMRTIMTHAESPMAAQTPKGSENRIMHAALELDGCMLLASDSMAGQPYEGMHGFSISLQLPTVADAKRVFEALSQGGTITMPLQKTFWSEAFGMLTDRFGAPWMVNVDAD